MELLVLEEELTHLSIQTLVLNPLEKCGGGLIWVSSSALQILLQFYASKCGHLLQLLSRRMLETDQTPVFL
jgi:hypothetical protein